MSVRRAASLAAFSVVAACSGFGLGGTAVPSLALLGGDLTALGPDNYCVDAQSSRPSAGFAILAPCRTISGSGPSVLVPAVIVVQADAAGSASVGGSEPAFAAFLESDAGAALLSASGNPEDIGPRRTRVSDGAVQAYFEDRGAAPVPGTQSAEWRAFIDLNGHLVTVGLRGLETNPLSRDAGTALLGEAIEALVSANP